MIVWSTGGGVQSTAIAALIALGRLPKPEFAVIADTGREAETTWSYLWNHVQPLLEKHGVPVEIASHDLATVDLYSTKGSLLIPAFTNHSGASGQLPGYCSVEWKRRVVRRYLRQRGVKQATLWIGISMNEIGRAKDSDVDWLTHAYPLLDLKIRRKDCPKIIMEAGLPWPAPRSACWMCPYRREDEWKSLTSGDKERALAFEAEIQKNDPSVFLRPNFQSVDAAWDDSHPQGELFGEVGHCDSGYCWT